MVIPCHNQHCRSLLVRKEEFLSLYATVFDVMCSGVKLAVCFREEGCHCLWYCTISWYFERYTIRKEPFTLHLLCLTLRVKHECILFPSRNSTDSSQPVCKVAHDLTGDRRSSLNLKRKDSLWHSLGLSDIKHHSHFL